MIKNFHDSDEDDSLITEQSFQKTAADEKDFEKFAAAFSRIEARNDERNDDPIEVSAAEIEKSNEEKFWESEIEALKREEHAQPDEYETFAESPNEPLNFESPFKAETIDFQPPIAETVESAAEKFDETKYETTREKRTNDYPIFSQSPYQTETSDETIRKSGLAYAAAIILFGSIVFTLILGWFADLLLGTSPWGKVGGIILGAVIGFIQFFRTTSQILKNKD